MYSKLIPNFPRPNRRVVAVVSKVRDSLGGFTLEASLSNRDHPVVQVNPFSPNGDDRKDSSPISFFLPPTNNEYNYKLELGTHDPPGVYTQFYAEPSRLLPGHTYVYTWTPNGALINDGLHRLELRTTEVDAVGSSVGPQRIYTTVTIDNTPPAAIANLTFTPGSSDGHDPERSPDILRWDAISDSSPGGGRYLVFQSTAPITSTDSMTPFKRTAALTETLVTFPHVPSSRYYALVAEDAAGNRGPPALVETDQGKIDLLLIVDDSTSMDPTELQIGVTASQSLIDVLEDKDRVAIRDIAAARPSLPFILLDLAARATARSTLAAYATANESGSPMDAALQWALAQFDQPGIANDGRPHYIVAFTDGEWSITQATSQKQSENHQDTKTQRL